jgi:malonyl-CoA O-methyltransferase
MNHALRRSTAARFTAAAATYDAHDEVQCLALDGLTARLDGLPPPSRVLEIGCGTGRLTAWMRAHWPVAEITAVDISAGMIRRARARLGADSGVRWITAPAEEFHSSTAFDLVASNCALHWLDPFEVHFVRLARMTAPGGRFAASVMLDGTLHELHEARRIAAPDNPAVGVMPARETVERLLAPVQWTAAPLREAWRALVRPSAREILKELREQGLTGGPLGQGARLLTRGELASLVRAYEQRFRTAAGVAASYRIAWMFAQRRP